jgi:hypothetical protein
MEVLTLVSSVSDPDFFIPDPDPAFLAEYQSGSDSGYGSRVLMTKNLKNLQLKIFSYYFLTKN